MANHERYRQAERAYFESERLQPTERFLELPTGNRVRVQESGQGDPLVFVHGGSSSGANFAPLMQRLTGVRCIAIDRPGCGLSDPVPNLRELRDLDAFASYADRLVVDVLDAMELPTASVAATSAGGLFALRGAAAHPDRFDKLIGIAWLIGAPMMKVPLSIRISLVPGVGAVSAKIPPTRFAVKMILKQIGVGRALASGKISEEMMEWFLALLRDTNTLESERLIPDIVLPFRGPNEKVYLTDDQISRIDMPTLFLWGDEDPMGGAEVAEPFADRFPHATLEMIHQAGHAPWIDEPDLIASRIVDFIGTN